MNTVLILSIGALITSAIVAAVVRAYASHLGVIAKPNERSSHERPTPTGGGLGIVVAAALMLALASGLGVVDTVLAGTLIVGSIALAFVGWLDDRRGVHPALRLPLHLLVGIFAVAMMGGLPRLTTGIATISLGPAGSVLAVIGIVWSINLFNFMDGLDGLAGSQALLIFGSVSVLALAGGHAWLTAIGALLATASVGFLLWNWPPAQVFMGDVGSAPLGFLVSALAIASENRGGVPLLIVAILGGPLVFDATATLLRRALRREPLGQAHRSHAYQRLARYWSSHLRVTLAMGGLTTVLASLAAVADSKPGALLPAVLLTYILLGALYLAVERRAPM